MATYDYDVIGTSNSGGLVDTDYGMIITGESQSLGGTILRERGIDLVGGSNSSGYFDDYPAAPGGSNSSGEAVIIYDIPVDGGSNSEGMADTVWAFDIAGGSNSGGTVVHASISALVDLACYVLNMDTNRTYEFTNYGFLGYGRFFQKLLGIKATSLLDLETVIVADDGVDIPAEFEFKSDFGLSNYKRFRSVFTEASGNIKITVTDENDEFIAEEISPDEFRSLQRNIRDKAFTVKIENIDGEKITLRKLHSKINVFERKGV